MSKSKSKILKTGKVSSVPRYPVTLDRYSVQNTIFQRWPRKSFYVNFRLAIRKFLGSFPLQQINDLFYKPLNERQGVVDKYERVEGASSRFESPLFFKNRPEDVTKLLSLGLLHVLTKTSVSGVLTIARMYA